ncbi:MAG TPA: hypothetical protein VGO94_05045 [Mycobacteriales bacterium]|jgi:hypothetical protein|nr:hypothetical protein [Actinomycetota bacterium]HEV7755208.1 hypothetical protein [Mycobacteriales bacterium]
MTRSRRLLLVGLALVLLAGYGIVTAVGAGYLARSRAYRPGSCVHRAGATVEPAPCAEPRALRIADRVRAAANCPRQTELTFTARRGGRFVLCLVRA